MLNYYFQATSDVDSAELKKREEYLKKQREKILAMKQQERQKSLNEYTASNATGAKARPKSARAAKQVTAGKITFSIVIVLFCIDVYISRIIVHFKQSTRNRLRLFFIGLLLLHNLEYWIIFYLSVYDHAHFSEA